MGSGRRITVALVALVLLAVIGWVVSQHDHAGQSHPSGVTVSPTAPTRAAASR